jgi:hypothetical protein
MRMRREIVGREQDQYFCDELLSKIHDMQHIQQTKDSGLHQLTNNLTFVVGYRHLPSLMKL